MKPSKETAIPSTVKKTDTFVESVAHLLNSRAASSKDAIIFLLIKHRSGQHIAMKIANALDWKTTSSGRA